MPGHTADEFYKQFEGAIQSGSDDADGRRRLMLEIGDALEEYGVLPESLAGLMDSVLLAWRSSETPAADDLLHAKETVWRTLDTRNGGQSTAIRDRSIAACGQRSVLPS